MKSYTPGTISGCWRKIAYYSEAIALVAAKEHDAPMRASPCRCGRWHLTRER